MYDIPFGRPMIGDAERLAVAEVLASPQLVHGPRARSFETAFEKLLGPGANATSVSSCTAGLHLIYMYIGIGPGDEVIVPALTHVATAHAVEVTGARPVFVDCDETGNIDVDLIENSITPRTRAICAVHYPGLPVDVRAINALANPRGIFVVEDCALAVGASLDGVACGLIGDAASFSFYPVKHLTTGEGGMVVSRHAKTTEAIASIKAFGYDRSPSARVVPGVYDISQLGLNYRMNEIAAAIGIVQVARAAEFAQKRQENARELRNSLADEPLLTLLPDGDERRVHANYCLTVVLKGDAGNRRNDIAQNLREKGIGTSVYYPVALPLSQYYSERYRIEADRFPNAQRLAQRSIALPLGPHLTTEDMTAVAGELRHELKEMAQ